MTQAFLAIDENVLSQIAESLSRDPEHFPLTETDIYHLGLKRKERAALAKAFREMAENGMNGSAAAWVLQTLVNDRQGQAARVAKVTPVWSGLDYEGTSRRALILLQDLFKEAKYRVWISSFNIDEKTKSGTIFNDLAKRYDEEPDLEVRFFLNIKRNNWEKEKGLAAEKVIENFSKRFKEKVWPGERLPEVYYDPRALDDKGKTMSCLHAKSVMIDDQKVLITSANFSEAAQIRNIEAGVVIEDKMVTETYCRNFQRLVEREFLVQLGFEEA